MTDLSDFWAGFLAGAFLWSQLARLIDWLAAKAQRKLQDR